MCAKPPDCSVSLSLFPRRCQPSGKSPIERLTVQRDALGQGSCRCELQVGLSSTSLLASATHVSHGMRWHQIIKEHAAKEEECCPPGRRAGTLNRSSAARNKEQKSSSMCFVAEVVAVREEMREEGENPLCAVFKLSRRRSEEHLPNPCTLALQGGK
ncbi:unnamed protein product [Pleuronectes platessa]|uniref:Uncharacterized protein n=1 Tax=Pleuronectes platessa TaxID=8262 RepID=A0A9N7U3E3_PLEPL|nr:unnamed protein product [Pleuronectes platessa]